jgi:hypothetical protein
MKVGGASSAKGMENSRENIWNFPRYLTASMRSQGSGLALAQASLRIDHVKKLNLAECFAYCLLQNSVILRNTHFAS